MYLILGFTKRTSYSLSKFLGQQGKTLVIADGQKKLEQQELIQQLSTQYDIIDELGNQDVTLINKYPIESIFISPGVPRSIPLVQEAIKKGITILNDIEYFYQCFPDRTYVAITGTDGKTTVTAWLGHVLSSQKPTLLVGNIGVPIFEYAGDEYKNHIFVVELSSFQLESLNAFHPRVAVITNIQEDHLDRYKDIDDYANTKKRIFYNQNTNDLALINKDDDKILSFADDINSTKKYFSCQSFADIYFSEDNIFLNDSPFLEVSSLKLVGFHNIQNALIVIAIAEFLGIKNIQESLCSFSGVEHRLEVVNSCQKITFYNDSKATTLQAVVKALESFKEPVILLAGGKGKGLDYSGISDKVKKHAKKVFSFGELCNELSDSWEGVEVCSTMKEAFDRACEFAQEGDVVLLSPGAASFDEFESFEHRGRVFKQLVQDFCKNNKR